MAGSKAQFKGSGAINGTGSYCFLLSAVDGTPDKFRNKIWEKTTGNVIYDSMPDAAGDSTPTTALSEGSIVIHK